MQEFDYDLQSIQAARDLARKGQVAANQIANYSVEQIDRILRGIDGDLFPVTENLTAVRPVNAGQNIHQRAFSCPVFSQQGVNFFRVHLQADILVCNDRTECLGNIFHLKNQFAHRAPLSVSSCSASCAG